MGFANNCSTMSWRWAGESCLRVDDALIAEYAAGASREQERMGASQ